MARARQAKNAERGEASDSLRAPADAALRESEVRYRRTFELAASGIAHIGLDRRFLRVNRRLCEILGYPESELVGMTGRELSHPDDLDIINKQRPRLYAGELDSVRVEKRYLRKDRSVVWVAFTMVVERDAAGKPQYEIAVFDDITARKAAEDALRESEARFRAVVESANEGILVYDKQLRVVAVNPAAEHIIGRPLNEIVGAPGFTSLQPCVLPDGSRLQPEQRPARVTAREGRPLTGYVLGIVRPEGRVTWLSINTGFLRRPGEAEWTGIVSTLNDITAQRNAELRVRESEARFRQTFELAASGLAHVGLDGRFLKVNKSLCEILGYGAEELVGRSVKEVSHPDDRDLTDAERAKVHTGEIEVARFEKRYLRKDGAVVWVDLGVAVARGVSGKPEYEVAIFDDITAQKKLEVELREKSELLQLGQAAARMIILDYDMKSDRLTWSDSPEWLRGPRPESGEYPLFRDQIHPEDRARYTAERAQTLATLQPTSQEYRIMRTDGQVLWVLARRQALPGPDGRAARLLVAMIDITERKEAEAAVRESEARFRSLTQLSSDWYWEQDNAFRLTFMSGRMGERTGLDAKSYLGQQRWDAPALNLTEEDWRRHRQTLVRHEPFRDFELERPMPEGGSRWIALSGEPVFDDNGGFTGYRGVGSDITARKRAEAELRRAHDELEQKARELQRSNSELEQFAYVASHDLQEPLRMVSSYTQLVMRRYGEKLDKDAREFMNYVVDGAARMKQLIEDLLAYSRVGTRGKEFAPVELEAIVRRAVTNLRAAIEEAGAAVTWEGLPQVRGDDMQLAQLLQNLIGNALKFRSASVPRVNIFSQDNPEQWEIVVQDNGIGIEPQYYERIFMVFQRLHNKAEYPGTGIGLAICKKVVERHGGRIWVESRPGEGSAFHFTLPKERGGAHD